MTANNDPLGVEFCLSVSRGRIQREGLLGSASRQTGFLHQAAVVSVGTITQRCPHVISALSTLSTDDSGISAKSCLAWQTSHRGAEREGQLARSSCLDVRYATRAAFKGIEVGQVPKSRCYSNEPHNSSAAWAKRRPWRTFIREFVAHGQSGP